MKSVLLIEAGVGVRFEHWHGKVIQSVIMGGNLRSAIMLSATLDIGLYENSQNWPWNMASVIKKSITKLLA